MLDSIWTEDAIFPPFPKLKHDLKTDVLIVGGGIAGILCAHALAQARVDYTLIEADRILRGVSRNTTAKITSQHGLIYSRLIREFDPDTARLYYEANEKALAQYRALAETIPCDFEEKDNYIYSTASRKKLEAEMAALEKLHIPAEFTEKLPLPFSTHGAVRFPGQGQFHPLKFGGQIAKGLRIYEHTPAREFAGNQVLTGGGRITAKKIIIATHFPILNKHGFYFMKMHQQRSYVLALEKGPDVGGIYLDEAKGGFSFRNQGNALLLGGGGHRTGKQSPGWADLEAFQKAHYPASPVTHRWATQDCMTLDGMPYIGQYGKAAPELYVATGFNKWGMTSAMVAAMILCDLVQEKENPFAAVFSPARTVWRQQLFCNAAESAMNLLTPTRPRCPHLGCALKWNGQERSWDCPCHGSRFAGDGELLNNPATGNLKCQEKGDMNIADD